MIKLNNKNITYVALADSNNSLKAPKEIWYADSSNSVKLVYRRKDALIEGEDYEKYHWLKGDGDAVITHKDINAFEVKILELDNTGVWYANGYVVNDANLSTLLYVGQPTNLNGNYSGLVIRRRTSVVTANYRTQSLNISLGEHIITKTTETDQIGVFTDGVRHIKNATSDTNYVGTNIIFNQLIPNQSLRIGYLSSPNIHNLIPCKLLKPVPKWLDANGIRRQVGECGMIDLISGKFYGNVNSVGTFTVENYYERKEWLQGRNGAYINTNHKLVTIEDRFDVKARLDGDLTRENDIFGYLTDNQNDRTYSIAIFHHLFGSNLCTSYCNYYGDAGTFRPIRHPISLNIPFTLSLYADSNEYHSVCNGNEIRQTTNGMITDTYDDVYLFNMNIGNPAKKSEQLSRYFNGDIAYFIISSNNAEVVHLIPCTLTMDLPASMDANNIPRTKGTSGMWDLVSDRFYGNVANSGTFKAVNLAEGVDYEVHQWLVGDNVAYIQGVSYDLWDSNHLEIKIGKVSVTGGIKYLWGDTILKFSIAGYPPNGDLMVIFRTDDSSTPHIADISPYSSMPDELTMDFYIENGLYYCNQNGVVKTNSSTQTPVESIWKSATPYIYSAKMSYIREVLSDGTYRSNLIPVKLLRSIPSKYDANGIARQAGECGMYDTVNDVFYGNVANGGSFTVSDN